MDKDIEIFRLQTAAAYYQSMVETSMNTALAFLVAITIFVLALVLESSRLGYPWYYSLSLALLIYLACGLSLYLYPLRRHIDDYKKSMEKLDRYAQDVEAGKPAPPLKDLIA